MSLICYTTRIHFADGVLEDALPEELRRRGVRAALILADAQGLRGEALARLADLWPDGTGWRLLECAHPGALPPDLGAAARGIGAEAVLGLGGPVAIEGARRAVADLQFEGGEGPLTLITVPVTPASVGLAPLPGGRGRLPDVVLCDPTLMSAACGSALSAAGMAALTACLEALIGTAWNPPADGIAYDGLRRAGRWLEAAVADRSDPAARRELLAAGLNAGLAAQKGFGALAALARAVEGALEPAPHPGWLNAALAGPVLAFNAPAAAERMALAAEALRLPATSDPGAAVAAALASLAARLGLPADLSELTLGPGVLDRIAEAAAEDGATRTNPRHATASDYRQLLAMGRARAASKQAGGLARAL
jgi:4-hydroxybutyrate dehydrogenase